MRKKYADTNIQTLIMAFSENDRIVFTDAAIAPANAAQAIAGAIHQMAKDNVDLQIKLIEEIQRLVLNRIEFENSPKTIAIIAGTEPIKGVWKRVWKE